MGLLTMQGPKTVQEAIAQFEAVGQPDHAELIRRLSDRQTFALLVDRLPHAIEAGCEEKVIAVLKMWGAWHGLYPVDCPLDNLLSCKARAISATCSSLIVIVVSSRGDAS
jgi:hypothetical protein